MKKWNVQTWSPKKKVISLTLLAFLLVFVGALSYGNVTKASDLKAVKKQISDDIESRTAAYVKNYITCDGEYISPSGVDISGSIACSVTDVTMERLNSTNLSSNDVNTLVRATNDTIKNQADAMGLNLSNGDMELLTNGVQSIVITSVYKAIADRGLVSVNDVETMKKGLEDRLKACESVVSNEADEVYDVIGQISQVVNELETESSSASVGIVDLNNKISTLEDYVTSLSTGDGNSSVSEVQLAVITSSIDSIKTTINGIQTQDSTQKKQLEELAQRMDSFSAGDGLTQDDLDDLSNSLNEMSDLLSDDIAAQATKIDSLNSSLSNLSTEFTSSLARLQNAQSNTEIILENITYDIAEGGAVDVRIAELCNEMALALGAELEESNTDLTGKINSLGSTVSLTQNALSDLESEFITVNVKISDLEEEQSQALATAASELQSKIDATSSDIASLQEVNTNLENLVAGNHVNISNLTSSLETAKTDLVKAMEDADGKQKEELESLISSVESAQAAVNSSYQTQLEDIEKQMTVKIEALEDSQSEALKTAASSLQSAIDNAASDVSSLQSANTALQELVGGNATDISKLSSSLETAKTDLVKAMEDADEEQKEELESLIGSVESAQAAVNKTYNDKLSALESSIVVQIGELESSQNAALTAATSDLQKKIDTTNTNVSSLQVASDNLQGLVNGNATNITTLSSSLETAKTDLVKAMEDADEEQKKDLEALISSVETAQAAVNSSYQGQLSAMEKSINDKDSAQTSALETAKANLTTQLSGLSDNLTSAQGNITSLQTSLNEVTTKADANMESISDIKSDVTDLNSELSTVVSDVKGVEDTLKEISDGISDLDDAKAEIKYDNSSGTPTLTITKISNDKNAP